jgi:hypothetical protein
MAIDFDGIRRRLRWRLGKLRWRAADANTRLLRLGIELLEDRTAAAELEARDQDMNEQSKAQHEKYLFMSVGQALSLWAQMEETLVVITGRLVRTEFAKAGIIMYSIINFGIWLSIIDELFSREQLYRPLKRKWNKINERLKKAKRIRDRLAHQTVHSGQNASTFEGDTSLRPVRLDTRHISQTHQPLDFDQILEFTASVTRIITDLALLINAMTELLKRETSQGKSSGQDPGQNPA